MKYYSEVFDNPYPYEWGRRAGEDRAEFVTDDDRHGVVGFEIDSESSSIFD